MTSPPSSLAVQKTTLSNGVRVLVDPIRHVKSAAIGLWCKTGSRHEEECEGGITHLIEHMLFKGTERRTAKQIAQEIEGRGGMLNAFTDKEQTCYYCRVLADDVPIGLDVLADMMMASAIAEEELAKEKGVVLEEIKRSEDEPGDHVHELHLHGRWGDHPLGRPIIGTRESVSGFERGNLKSYMARQYRAENVLLAVSGYVEPELIVEFAERTMGDIPSGANEPTLTRPQGTAKNTEIKKEVEQVHFCVGSEGTSLFDDDLYSMAVMDAILGGGMSSRLFQEIREKRGLAYAIGSYSLSYSAGGSFTVYGGTGQATWDEVQLLIRIEFDRLMKEGVAEDELQRAKQNICGHIVLAHEGMSARMMRMARHELHYHREIPIEESVDRIRSVSASQVQDLANRLLGESMVSTTAICPN